MVDASTIAERFWSKVDRARECWIWTGTKSLNGYGRFDIKGRRIMAHRVAYEMEIGPIPEGLQIDHLCRTRDCVRPSHLEAVTQHVNILRSDAPTALNARRTECIHGHPFTVENTYATPDGRRQCRVCIRARLAAHEHRHLAA